MVWATPPRQILWGSNGFANEFINKIISISASYDDSPPTAMGESRARAEKHQYPGICFYLNVSY
jgi:hypothetical protein